MGWAAIKEFILQTEKRILDPCCGSKMFWFDREHRDVVFGDNRREVHKLCDGRTLQINPDIDLDFRDMPFEDGSFKVVVFDPPHLRRAGADSWMAKKYGVLGEDWRNDIRMGFSECFRVLSADGVLIFKWAEVQIKTSEVLKLADHKPLFGHKSGLRSSTHWIVFMKPNVK